VVASGVGSDELGQLDLETRGDVWGPAAGSR
jgi:hypothetical protein